MSIDGLFEMLSILAEDNGAEKMRNITYDNKIKAPGKKNRIEIIKTNGQGERVRRIFKMRGESK